MKIVVNKCYGGFGLSEAAYNFLGLEWDGYGYADIPRNDPKLVECVETLGDKVNGRCAQLCITEIPDDIDWVIEEYDEKEWVVEKHQTW